MSSTNCEDLAELEKIQSQMKNSELNENREATFLPKEFYINSSEHLQEEMICIGLLIRIFLEKSRTEAGRIDGTFQACSY